MRCNNPNCEACNPPDDGKPRLHGWITPEYAVQQMSEMAKFLKKHGYKVTFDAHL